MTHELLSRDFFCQEKRPRLAGFFTESRHPGAACFHVSGRRVFLWNTPPFSCSVERAETSREPFLSGKEKNAGRRTQLLFKTLALVVYETSGWFTSNFVLVCVARCRRASRRVSSENAPLKKRREQIFLISFVDVHLAARLRLLDGEERLRTAARGTARSRRRFPYGGRRKGAFPLGFWDNRWLTSCGPWHFRSLLIDPNRTRSSRV